MKSILALLASITLAATLAGSSALASDGIMIPETSGWARSTPPGVTTTAIYLTVMNHGSKDINLLSVESDISSKIELHTHKHEDGVMKMQQVASIAIAAGDQTELKPHAEHIMVFNLNRALETGERVTVELKFDDGKTHTVEVPVLKEAPDADAGHGDHTAHKKK